MSNTDNIKVLSFDGFKSKFFEAPATAEAETPHQSASVESAEKAAAPAPATASDAPAASEAQEAEVASSSATVISELGTQVTSGEAAAETPAAAVEEAASSATPPPLVTTSSASSRASSTASSIELLSTKLKNINSLFKTQRGQPNKINNVSIKLDSDKLILKYGTESSTIKYDKLSILNPISKYIIAQHIGSDPNTATFVNKEISMINKSEIFYKVLKYLKDKNGGTRKKLRIKHKKTKTL